MVVLVALALAACGSPALAARPPRPITPATRARIETTLTSGAWRSGYSGSTVWHWQTLHFSAPDRVEQRNGHRSHSDRSGAPDVAHRTQVGTFRITDTGAVEQVLGGETARATFVVAPAGRGGRIWADTGYAALGPGGRSFRHERARRTASGDGFETECDLELSAPLASLDDATCRMTVRVRARVFAGGSEKDSGALDVEGRCSIDRSGALPRLSFEGFEQVDPVQATAEWTNWLSRTGRSDPSASTELADAMRMAFVPVLAYDPTAPDALFAAYVTGMALDPPAAE